MAVNLLDLSFADLTDFVAGLGEPKYRAAQLWQWLWQKDLRDVAEVTTLSKAFRARLAEAAAIVRPRVAKVSTASDETTKFLLELADGEKIEAVLIPEGGYWTLCLSTQVGCPMACAFCATGTLGFTRNLTQSEILGQVLVARAHLGQPDDDRRLTNLVFMGMGEPLLNYDTLMQSLETASSDTGLGFSRRRMTVSTSGIRGRMAAFGRAELGMLAISLHAPTQELREKIMPVAAKALPLPELLAELKTIPLKARERLTVEYVLIKGVNDSDAHARDLVRALSFLKCKVNLIAMNPGGPAGFEAPDEARVLAFENILRAKHMPVTLRRSKGREVAAACGQLAAEAARCESGLAGK